MVKADPTVQKQLVGLAGVDGELNRLAHRRRTLPELAELAAAEATVRTRKDALVAVETTAGDLDRDITRIERDVEAVRARTARDDALLAGSGVGARQAAELQHELTTLARRREVLEDEQLELMERREAVEADVAHSRAQLSAAQDEVQAVTARRDAALADVDAGEAGRRRERATFVAGVPEAVLAAYDRSRDRAGAGVAVLAQRRCGACRLELDRTALAELRAAPPDELVQCSECSVLLVRTAESGL